MFADYKSYLSGTPFISEPSFTISSPTYASGSGIPHSVMVSSPLLLESSTAAKSPTPTVDGGNEQSKDILSTFPSLSVRSVYVLASSEKLHTAFSAREIDRHTSKVQLTTNSKTLSAAGFESSNAVASISLQYKELTTSLNAKTISGVYPKYTETVDFNSNSRLITPALHEIKETTEAYRHGEIMAQSLSSTINDRAKETVAIDESSRIQHSSTSATNSIVQSAFSTSHFDGKASVIQRNRTSINATDSAILEQFMTRMNQNGSNDSPTIKENRVGNVMFWLIIGTTVVISSILITIVAAKFLKSGKGR